MPMSYLSGKSSSPGTSGDDLDYSMDFWDESSDALMMLDSACSSMESTPLCTDKNVRGSAFFPPVMFISDNTSLSQGQPR